MPTTYAIPDGRTVMAATTYTGNGTSQSISNAVNGVSFQPDMAWVKDRSAARSHILIDAVRGTGLTLFPNETTADQSNTDRITSFNSNGFSVGTGLGVNASTETYVGWQWNAGGSTVTNTSGTITSQVRANPTAGFSVVTYTGNGTSGATVGHGLGVAPAMMIVKNRSSGTEPWRIYQKNMAASPATVAMNFDTGAASASSTRWNNTAPTSSVFTVGNDASVNANTNNYVAYLFAAVAGYSAFGSYTGNGSADGVFVYLGFRARFLMIKRTDSTGGWVMLDTARDTYNDVDNYLYANSSAANAGSSNVLDINSNGFKIRNSWTDINASGGTYVYMAFCENPFKYANAR